MPTRRVTFDPEGPLWDMLYGEHYSTWPCPLCNVEFDERSNKGVAWVSKHGMLCCSEICARLNIISR
jgi:hypothetical protein